jgi:hypothetical protein
LVLDPEYHSKTVKLVAATYEGFNMLMLKRVMFCFLPEVLNEGTPTSFLALKKGETAVNRRCQEQKRQARKRITKKGWHDKLVVRRDAEVVSKRCLSCGEVFTSWKQLKKHRKAVPSCAVPNERQVRALKLTRRRAR